jgi:replicative superfamily II helicase
LVLQSIGLLGGSALEEEIVDYWNDSLFCYQYANGKVMIENRVRWVLEDLKFSDLVEVDKVGVIEQYSLTEIGEVVARFCVDVNTVLKFIDLIDEIDKKRNVIGVIDLLVRSGVVELLSGRKDEIVRLARDILWLCENSYIGGFNGEDEKHVVRIVKTIKLLDEWLSGKDVNVAVLNLEDIERYVSCFGLISKYLGYEDLYGWFRDLQLRVRYGVPANLVDIVRQKGVGRKKALRYLNMKKLTKCV